MNKFFTLRKKIYFLSLLSGLFFIGIAWSAYINVNSLSEYFFDFRQTSNFAKKNIQLAENIAKLQNNVQRFTYTGEKEEAQSAKKLFDQINFTIDESSLLTEPTVTKSLSLIKVHLEKYMSTFSELERQMSKKKQLRIDKSLLSKEIEEELEGYLKDYQKNSYSTLLINLHQSLQKAEKNALYFFETLDSKYVKSSKKEFKEVKNLLKQLIIKEQDSKQKEHLTNILKNTNLYSSITAKEILHTRGNLFLVNVIMAAEAYEILYQATLISDISDKLLNKIDHDVNVKVDTLIRALGLTSVLSLIIMMGISLFIIRSIVGPISNLTKAFIGLSKGNTDSLIPTYHVKDEIGGLTKAAEAFRTKNKEMEELLLRSDTLREELSLSEERFTLALEGAKDGLWDWNIITDEVYYSNTWKNMFGYKEDEISDQLKEWGDRIHPDDLSRVMNDLTQYLEGKSQVYESEMRIQCQDGSYKHILARGKAITSDGAYVTRMLGLHMDITEQKELEQSLIESKIIADNANKAKSDFLANMSHEIRTPLNGILGLTDLLLKTGLNEKQTGYLKKSKTSSQALLRVINDILDYSKIEAGKLDLEFKPFNLAEIIKNIKDLFEYQANHKGIELIVNSQLPPHTMLIGDGLRLTQILTNLMGNAIKFTQKGSVVLSISVLKDDNGFQELKFSVKDSGIGISKVVQENLFKEFSQADTSITRKYGGTGLGLAISKQLVHMMEGKIWIESAEGKGSEFIFTLSLQNAPKQNQQESLLMPLELDASHLDALKGVKILLAEDNKVNQIVAMGLLEDYLVEIDIANNGQEAVDMASKGQYAIILMDLQMPVMDGFEATKLIREMDNYKKTPIFALSAAVMQQDKELTQAAGMDEHLAKPIDKELLVKTLVAYA